MQIRRGGSQSLGIGNRMPWQLDVIFKEDDSHVR